MVACQNGPAVPQEDGAAKRLQSNKIELVIGKGVALRVPGTAPLPLAAALSRVRTNPPGTRLLKLDKPSYPSDSEKGGRAQSDFLGRNMWRGVFMRTRDLVPRPPIPRSACKS